MPRRRKSLFGAKEIQMSSSAMMGHNENESTDRHRFHLWLSPEGILFQQLEWCWISLGTSPQVHDDSLEKEAIPMQVPGDREEAVRRGGGASPSPLIQFCSISNTSREMMFKPPGWQRLVTAGSPASSSEVNCMTLRLFMDVSERANSTLLL